MFQDQIQAMISQVVSHASDSASGGSQCHVILRDSQSPTSPFSDRSSKKRQKKKKKRSSSSHTGSPPKAQASARQHSPSPVHPAKQEEGSVEGRPSSSRYHNELKRESNAMTGSYPSKKTHTLTVEETKMGKSPSPSTVALFV